MASADDINLGILARGPKGDTGPQGPQGPKGDKGDTGTVDNAGLTTAPAFVKLQTQVNNSAVGTNLLMGTRDWQGDWKNLPLWMVSEETYKGLTVRYRDNVWSGLMQYYDADPNTTYTFSFYAKASEADNSMVIFVLDSDDWSSPVVSRPDYVGQTITTEWQRYSVTFTTKSGGKICPNVCPGKYGITIYTAGYKLEKGSVATDWTPAPEDRGDRGPRGFSIIPIKSTLGGNLSDIDYSSLFFDSNIVPNVGDYLLEKNGDLVEVTEVNDDNNTFSFGNIIGSLKGPIGRTGENGRDGLSAYQLAINNGFKGTEKEWLDSLKVSNESSARHAPTGWTLDRTTNPWTIWFDNGCGLQIPNYGTLATVYGYGFPVNIQNTSLDVWPLAGVVMSASHGTLTLDAISKTIDHADYWEPNAKVINPIRTDAGDYDWSNVYFNDGSRDRKGQYQSDRQKVMLRVMYELGIFSAEDLKPFGLVKK